MSKKTFYGIDAPVVIRNFFLLGLLSIVVGLALWWYFFALIIRLFALSFFIGGIAWIVTALWMVWSSLYGKYRQAQKLLDQIPWKGDEIVLDVGCGRGLILNNAAKRLNTGKAYGIDIWQAYDLSSNAKQETLNNAQREGVADTVIIMDADVRALPFTDGFFDVVVSSMVIHNLYDFAQREKAIKEMRRVLKPGGILLIQDFQHTDEYQRVMQQLGFKNVTLSPLSWWIFPPVRIVKGNI